MKQLIARSGCDVGLFMVVYKDPGLKNGLAVTGRLYPDYAGAENEAKQVAKAAVTRTCYIVQIRGQLQSVAEVYEVRPSE